MAGADATHYASGYYSFDIGAWHLIALNSNCASGGRLLDRQPAGAVAEERPGRAPQPVHARLLAPPALELRRARRRLRHGRFLDRPLRRAADLVLNGHGNHHYERIVPQTARKRRPGERRSASSSSAPAEKRTARRPATPTRLRTRPRSATTRASAPRLSCVPSYDWQFVPEVGGNFTDSGTGTCHAAPRRRRRRRPLTAAADSAVHLSWNAPSDGGSRSPATSSTAAPPPGGETPLKTLGTVTSYDDSAVTAARSTTTASQR